MNCIQPLQLSNIYAQHHTGMKHYAITQNHTKTLGHSDGATYNTNVTQARNKHQNHRLDCSLSSCLYYTKSLTYFSVANPFHFYAPTLLLCQSTCVACPDRYEV